MEVVHALIAIFAAHRFMDLIMKDRIFAPIRWLRPGFYLWTCEMCVSIWAGVIATLLLVYFPWGNYPFALSTLALTYRGWRLVRMMEGPRVMLWPNRFGVNVDLMGGISQGQAADLIKQASNIRTERPVAGAR